MKKLSIALLFFLFQPFLGFTQKNVWNAQIGYGFYLSPQLHFSSNSIIADDNGNSYVTGSDNGDKMYIYRYNSAGVQNLTISATGSGTSSGGTVKLDNFNNLYVLGSYTDSTQIGSVLLTGSGNFLAKYSTSGVFLWVKKLKYSPTGLAIGSNGYPYIIGSFVGTVSINGVNYTSFGGSDILFTKFNSTGTIVWTRQIGGSGNDNSSSISIDPLNNLYVAGKYNSSISFGINYLSGSGGFFAKYTSSGTYVWSQNCSNLSSIGPVLSTDKNGNIFIQSKVNFISKYSGSGNILWNKKIVPDNLADPSSICRVDKNGNIFVTGKYRIGSGTYATFYTILIAKYKPDGTLAWWQQSGGGINDLNGVDISSDSAGNAYIIAYLRNGINPYSYYVNKYSGNKLSLYGFKNEPICPSQFPQIGYCTNGNIFNSGNIFTAEISYNNSWLPIGVKNSTTDGIINVQLPEFLPAGNYDYRISASNPAIIGDTILSKYILDKVYPVISTSGPTTFCQGDSVTLIPTAPGATFLWKEKYSTLTFYTDTIAINSNGSYSLETTYPFIGPFNDCILKSSTFYNISVNPLPIINITASGPTTFCNGDSVNLISNDSTFSIYQWKLAGANIFGANNYAFTAKPAGTYKVKVTDQNGCTKISNNINVVVNCKEDSYYSNENSEISLFPNPSNGNVSINFNSENTTSEIRIINSTGQEIFKKNLNSTNGFYQEDIDLSGMSKGIYLVQIKNSESIKTVRFIRD